MNLDLDDEAIKMIEEFKTFEVDESYARHLAYKILELFEEQIK